MPIDWNAYWKKHRGAAAIASAFVLFALVLPLVFIDGPVFGAKSLIPWAPYSERALADAKAANQPVMIDFYADWCGPCHELEHRVFARKEVAEAVAAAGFVTLQVDMTDEESPGARKLAEQYAIAAFPTVVFIGRDGQERTRVRLLGVEQPKEFINRLHAIP